MSTAQNRFRDSPSQAEKKESKPLPKLRFMPFLADARTRAVLGVALMAFSFFLLFSLVSHLLTGRADQSLVHPDPDLSIIEAGREAENWMGYFGAWISDWLMFRGFGIAAILIAPMVFSLGYVTAVGKPLLGQGRPFFRVVVSVLLLISSLLGLVVYQFDLAQHFSWLSGAVGFEIANLVWSLLKGGAWLVWGVAAVAFVVFTFNTTSIGGMRRKIKNEIGSLANINKQEQELANKINGLTDGTIASVEAEPIVSIDNDVDSEVPTEDDVLIKVKVKGAHDPLQMKVTVPEEEKTIEQEPYVPPTKDQEEFIYNPPVVEVTGTKLENYDPTLDLAAYKYPVLDLLDDTGANNIEIDNQELNDNKERIVDTLKEYGIGVSSIAATVGPTVTLYEIIPDKGVRISKIKNLEDDIALSLAALGIRIIAPMPGKGTVGIEVPNKNRKMVSIRSVLATEKFMRSDMALPIILGKTISNEVFIYDLAKMPHLLMAGATGQGKSVGLNVLLTSLIYKKHPSQLKFVLVDPKKVELSIFSLLERHFLAKLPSAEEAIITDTKKVINTLHSLTIEMGNRYDLLKDAGCRNLKEYNDKFVARMLNPEHGHYFMPYIVVVIDELADLMMTAGKEVEQPIARLAQLARAIGIHLVVATQRPSVNVITGIIKANFPARLSFKVSSKVDSRTILDTGGADRLLSNGDMLFTVGADMIRLQCPFINTDEVGRIMQFIGTQRGYASAYQLPDYVSEDEEVAFFDPSNRDAKFEEAARLIVMSQQGSTSLLQRKLELGYARSGRLMDQLEAAGIVGPARGSKVRDVLYKDSEELENYLRSLER